MICSSEEPDSRSSRILYPTGLRLYICPCWTSSTMAPSWPCVLRTESETLYIGWTSPGKSFGSLWYAAQCAMFPSMSASKNGNCSETHQIRNAQQRIQTFAIWLIKAWGRLRVQFSTHWAAACVRPRSPNPTRIVAGVRLWQRGQNIRGGRSNHLLKTMAKSGRLSCMRQRASFHGLFAEAIAKITHDPSSRCSCQMSVWGHHSNPCGFGSLVENRSCVPWPDNSAPESEAGETPIP